MDYFKANVAPWIGKFDRVKGKKELLVLVSSDHHSQWLDKFMWHVFIDCAKRMQPDVIVLNGDVMDCHDLSRFAKDPTAPKNLQGEVNFVRNMLKQLRAACPDTQIDWIEGNHEWRLVKYLTDAAPGLAGLRCLEFGPLMGLDDYEVNVVARRGFRNESARMADKRNYKIYGDRALIVTHGSKCGTNPARSELVRWGMTGISGHIHRPGVAATSDLFQSRTWTTTGCMARRELAHTYNESPVEWVQGFAYAAVSGQKAIVHGIVNNGGFIEVGGKRYHDPKSGSKV
jgi:predicted phosphodiesterase